MSLFACILLSERIGSVLYPSRERVLFGPSTQVNHGIVHAHIPRFLMTVGTNSTSATEDGQLTDDEQVTSTFKYSNKDANTADSVDTNVVAEL